MATVVVSPDFVLFVYFGFGLKRNLVHLVNGVPRKQVNRICPSSE